MGLVWERSVDRAFLTLLIGSLASTRLHIDLA
jgi:hypothetical protein